MTAREQLNKCLDIKNKIHHRYDLSLGTSTSVGTLTTKLMNEAKVFISLLPAYFAPWKKLLEDDLKNMSSHNNRINAFTYGAFERTLVILDKLLSECSSKKIFISHSSLDKEVVEAFVMMLCLGTGLKMDDIFCTSIEGIAVENGKNIREHIKTNINYADFAILMVSANYKRSKICLNEMGAVWAMDKKVKTYVLPDTKESDVGWLIDCKAAEKVNSMTALVALYEELVNFYKIKRNLRLWTSQAEKFCNKITNNC